MQSGKAKTKGWVLEFEQSAPRRTDPLMGWTGASDMQSGQVRLHFDSKEEAVEYAVGRGLPHQVIDRKEAKPSTKAYSDNFDYHRRAPWTH